MKKQQSVLYSIEKQEKNPLKYSVIIEIQYSVFS